MKIKVNFCIEALHLSEQVSLLDGLPCINVLHKSLTTNALVIMKNNDQVYSKRISAISQYHYHITLASTVNWIITEGRFFDKNTPYPVENPRTYDFVVSTTGLKLRKEALTNRATLMNIQGCTLQLVEASPSGVRAITNPELFKELEQMADNEGMWRKYARWLIGLNWKALLAI